MSQGKNMNRRIDVKRLGDLRIFETFRSQTDKKIRELKINTNTKDIELIWVNLKNLVKKRQKKQLANNDK